jgi:hypothetical protein
MDLEDALRKELAAEAGRSAGVEPVSKEAVLRRSRARQIGVLSAGFGLATAVAASLVFLVPDLQRDVGTTYVPGVSSSPSPSEAAGVGDCRTIPTGGSSDWYSTPSSVAALESFGGELEKETGALPGSPDGLDKGLIGIAVDHTTQTVYVVVDSALFPVEGMQARLQGLVDAEFKDRAEEAFPVRLIESCNTAAELRQAGATLDAQAWHPAVKRVAHIWGLDAYTSTWKVTFDETDPEAAAVADALVKELGPLVTIAWTEGIETH